MRFHTFPLLLFSFAAFAGPAIQFCADRPQKVTVESSGVAVWTSMDGDWSLVPVHTNDIGWCAPSYSARSVRFGLCDTNTVSPLQFPASATTLVSRAFLVANGTNATSLATLLDAPVPLRLSPRFFAGDTWYFEPSNVLGTASVTIDAAESDAWPLMEGLHLVEIAFGAPCTASELYLGGNPDTPDWNRSWDGGIAEVILLDDSVAPETLPVLRAYLGLKWSLPFDFETPNNARAILTQLGIRSDPLYSTFLMFH